MYNNSLCGTSNTVLGQTFKKSRSNYGPARGLPGLRATAPTLQRVTPRTLHVRCHVNIANI